MRSKDNNLPMCEFPGTLESNLWGAELRCGQLNARYEQKKVSPWVHMGPHGSRSRDPSKAIQVPAGTNISTQALKIHK